MPCPDDTADFTITVNALPVALDQSPQLCEDVLGGGSVAGVDLTLLNSSIDGGGAGNVLSWFTDQPLTSPVGTPTNITVNNGDVFYVLVDNGTCTDTAMVTYIVANGISLTNPNDSLCEDVFGGGSVANVDLTSYNSTVFTGIAPVYVWYTDVALTVAVGTPTNVTIIATTNDTFYVDVTDGTCNNNVMITFTVKSQSVGVLDSTICSGASFVFNGITYDGSNLSGAEILVAANGCDSVVTVTVIELSAITGTVDSTMCTGGSFVFNGTAYDVNNLTGLETLVAANGCDSVVAVTLTIDPQLSITAMNDVIICSSSDLVLTATASGSGTVEWYSDVAGTVLVGTGSPLVLSSPGNGIFTYYVTEVGGTCPSNTDSVTITIGGVVAVIDATPLAGVIPLNVTLGASNSTGAITGYQWDFENDGNIDDVQVSTGTTYNSMGTYTVMLIVTNGSCSDTAYVIIDAFGESAILIPNVFTPNGDGQNDVFTVDGVNLESVEGEIFNRWGQKMFSWSNIKGHWDGRTLAGEEAPDGTYFYIITAIGVDGTEYFKKGGFSLIR